ncbi:DUF2264 domain-containing protein [Asticcacaulis machinosus]|uniref:DUF2264 domain-containing protein n=1 Tax=Asticcacaulis machinosus TaxID=2984211 RepID=A0ABT5HKK8_9CAUL|nr:DUF2264 domain-containing protein [Asticcacaulis machinosus]MDC7676149.1 DUF2264 domain-containing protein [Asticcacaulis machinosus]
MDRRNFLMTGLTGAAVAGAGNASAAKPRAKSQNDRAYTAGLLQKIAEPVLSNMAKGELKKAFKIEVGMNSDGRDTNVAYMEAFARLIAGVAPWLTLPEDNTPEGQVRRKLTQDALQAYVHSVDHKSPDYLVWRTHGQALVDSAYFTNALMRAPKQLWEPLDATTKTRIVTEIKQLRRVSPPYTNWLLFAAMNEVFLLMIGEDWDPMRVDLTIKKMEEWYIGDGWVADGTKFHFDYYNSYVIYPMIVEILEVLVRLKPSFNNLKPEVELPKWLKRMQRNSEHLERFISPTGTYPPIGRSLTYRTAAFQPLALLAWRKALPQSLPEGQVRAALTAVHKAIFTEPSNFTADGYLTIGFVGHHRELADWYTNSGSMYITSESFLALGLPPTDTFWTAPAEDWTQKKAFAGKAFPKDYHVDY